MGSSFKDNTQTEKRRPSLKTLSYGYMNHMIMARCGATLMFDARVAIVASSQQDRPAPQIFGASIDVLRTYGFLLLSLNCTFGMFFESECDRKSDQ